MTFSGSTGVVSSSVIAKRKRRFCWFFFSMLTCTSWNDMGKSLVEKSVAAEEPVIFVSLNYRYA